MEFYDRITQSNGMGCGLAKGVWLGTFPEWPAVFVGMKARLATGWKKAEYGKW